MNAAISAEMLDMLPFGVMMVGENLRVSYLNQWLRIHLEERAESALGAPLTEAFPELLEAGRLAAFQLVLQTGQPVLLSSSLHHYLLRLPAPPHVDFPWMEQMAYLLPSRGDSQSERVTGVVALIYDQSDVRRNERQLADELAKIRTLYDIDQALTTLNLQNSLDIIAQRIQHLLQADQAAIVLREGDELVVAASVGERSTPPGKRFSVREGLSGWVVRTGVSTLVGDVRKDRRYLSTDPALRSALVVPLVIGSRVAGAISVEHSALDAFDRTHLDLLETLASRAVIAIQNATLYRKVEEQHAFVRAILDHTGDVIFTLDTNLRVTTVNAAWDAFALQNGAPQLVGRKALGRDVLRSMTPDMRRKWEPVLRSLLAGERTVYSEDIPCHAPDKERWLNIHIAAMRDEAGNPLGLVCSTRDITRRVENERQLRRSNTQLHVLLDAMRLMGSHLGLRALLDAVVNFLCNAFDVPAAAFYTWDSERKDYSMLAGRGLSEAYASLRLPPLDEQSEGIEHLGMVSYIPNMRFWAQWAGLQPALGWGTDSVSSALLVRVFTHRHFAGLLALFTQDVPRRFSRDECDLLEALSAQFGVALENAQAFAEQQALALTDALTGLFNRRQFNVRLDEEVERAVRYHEPVSLMMVDLDDFKSFNDTFGHPAGDQVLKALAIVMRGNLRRVDVLARYGGEEFAVIMPRTRLASAFQVAERLRAAVEEQMQSIVADICAATPDKPPREKITISVGVSSAPRHAQDANTLLNQADIALYEAKRRGKNQVCLYRGSGSLQRQKEAAPGE